MILDLTPMVFMLTFLQAIERRGRGGFLDGLLFPGGKLHPAQCPSVIAPYASWCKITVGQLRSVGFVFPA